MFGNVPLGPVEAGCFTSSNGISATPTSGLAISATGGFSYLFANSSMILFALTLGLGTSWNMLPSSMLNVPISG